MGGQILTKDLILGASDIERVEVDCPEWGGSVIIRAMNGAQRDEFDSWCYANRPHRHGMRVVLVRLCAVDQNGTPLFDKNDDQLLQEKNGEVLTRLFMAASRLNKLGASDVDKAKEDLPAGQSA